MSVKLILALILTLSTVVLANPVSECPSKCKCDQKQVDCRNSEWTRMPKPVREDAETLILDTVALDKLDKSTFPALDKLKTLRLAGCSIRTVAGWTFSRMPKIEKLDLSDNELVSMPVESFAGLNELKELVLDDNKISSLPNELLKRVPKLETFSIRNNVLKNLADNFFSDLKSLKKISLENNRWNCNCQLLPLIKKTAAIAKKPGAQVSMGKCMSGSVQGSNLDQLSDEVLGCGGKGSGRKMEGSRQAPEHEQINDSGNKDVTTRSFWVLASIFSAVGICMLVAVAIISYSKRKEEATFLAEILEKPLKFEREREIKAQKAGKSTGHTEGLEQLDQLIKKENEDRKKKDEDKKKRKDKKAKEKEKEEQDKEEQEKKKHEKQQKKENQVGKEMEKKDHQESVAEKKDLKKESDKKSDKKAYYYKHAKSREDEKDDKRADEDQKKDKDKDKDGKEQHKKLDLAHKGHAPAKESSGKTGGGGNFNIG